MQHNTFRGNLRSALSKRQFGLRYADAEARSARSLAGPLSRQRPDQGCQMAKFDPFLSLDCARVEGAPRPPPSTLGLRPPPSTLVQSKERKGSNFAIWPTLLRPLTRERPGERSCASGLGVCVSQSKLHLRKGRAKIPPKMCCVTFLEYF